MTSQSNADLLEVRSVEVRYGPVRAVTGATFSVREGEIVVFTAAVPVGVSGGANMIKVVKVERGD